MKKRISSNTTWKRYVFASTAIVCTSLLFRELALHHSMQSEYCKIFLLCTLLSLSFYYFIRKRKHIEYDNNYLYIYNQQTKKKISFEDIKHLRLLIYRFNSAPTWKIVYQNNTKKEKVWLISSPKENEALNSFINKIEQEHPHIQITDDDEGII